MNQNNFSKKETITLTRIKKRHKRLVDNFYGQKVNFEIKYALAKKDQYQISFNDSKKLNYKKINIGDQWGKKWQSAWFQVSCSLPMDWQKKNVVALLDFTGEGLVFDEKGNILQGISSHSVFDPSVSRTMVALSKEDKKKKKISYKIEATSNTLSGIALHADPKLDEKDRFGKFDSNIKEACIAIFNEEVWNLYLDVRVLIGLLDCLPDVTRRSRILKSLNDAIDVYLDDIKNATKSRKVLENVLNKKADSSAISSYTVGHAHIDTAWLWTTGQSIKKSARTFASQVDLLERYPDYIFGASQPQHYQFIKDHYPDLYEKIKKLVVKGRWEVQGGMWIEADCNLISGESMVRQILHGKNFFKDEFNIDVDNLWLPDVFGYSAALPQILLKSGINYFLTQKISWSQFNQFPHHTFLWQGIDHSEILSHFPPENTYNSQLNSDSLVAAEKRFTEKDFIDEFMCLFGVGDGGGGPKAENIEMGRRMENLEGAPKVKFSNSKNFFKKLEKYRSDLKKWHGEIYLEYHRGTYTTQAMVKKHNRKIEYLLKAIEMLYCCLPMKDYPQKELDQIWKVVLINQFHDIIPGSSINEVYKQTYLEYQEINKKCELLLKNIQQKLFIKNNNSISFFNPLNHSYFDIYELPISWRGYHIEDKDDKEIFTQEVGEKLYCLLQIPALSFIHLNKVNKKKKNEQQSFKKNLCLENDFILYQFNSEGCLVKAFDKELKKEFCAEKGNLFTLYEDRPNLWDAWDVDFFYRKAIIENAKCIKINKISSGKIVDVLEVSLSIGNSNITQQIFLSKNSKRLNFFTTVDWNEKHKMLRVQFPVNVETNEATFDIQYGKVKREVHNNTIWEEAKFEVVAHKYADLSNADHGVALMNDCKYGYFVKENILDLNLLRSPNYPDPDADIGIHTFTYSFYPHDKTLEDSDVIQQANVLNQLPVVFYQAESKQNSFLDFPFSIVGDNLSVEAIKKEEKGDGVVIRVVETLGKNSKGKILFSKSAKLNEVDLIEWKNLTKLKKVNKEFQFQLKPFEIKTFYYKEEK